MATTSSPTIASVSPTSNRRTHVEVAWRKLQIETRLKLLAKWNPRKYGDRVGIDHAGGVSIVLKTNVPDAGD
jgi:hypothetical protein